MNFIADQASGTRADALFTFEDEELRLPYPTPGKVTLGQRPEHIQLDPEAPWRGEVALVEPTGAYT